MTSAMRRKDLNSITVAEATAYGVTFQDVEEVVRAAVARTAERRSEERRVGKEC